MNKQITLITSFLILIFLSQSVHAIDLPINWQGQAYQENALAQAGWAERFFFDKYSFTGSELILDIGSGDGNLTAKLAQNITSGHVIGIDNSRSMVQTATRSYKRVPNLRFIQTSAQDLEFYDNNPEVFDLVVSFSTLHWVSEQSDVLQGMHAALKPGGRYFLKFCSKGGDPIQDIADSLTSNDVYAQYFSDFVDPMTRFSEVEYKQLIQNAHLELDSIKDVEEHDKVGSIDDLKKQIISWLPHYHHINRQSNELAQQFLADIVEQYVWNFPPNMDGSVVLYDHYLEVVGHKAEV